MPWTPGQSGNPEGSQPRQKRWLAALERAILQDDGKRLREAAEKLLDMAAQGEAWAVKELADRLDGKPKQQLEATGADGVPLSLTLVAYDSLQIHSEAVPTADPEGAGLRH